MNQKGPRWWKSYITIINVLNEYDDLLNFLNEFKRLFRVKKWDMTKRSELSQIVNRNDGAFAGKLDLS